MSADAGIFEAVVLVSLELIDGIVPDDPKIAAKCFEIQFQLNPRVSKPVGHMAISFKPEEIEAAHFLADKGYKVILKDEAGHVKTPDGYTFSYTFEQSTPVSAKGENGFKNRLQHARDKAVDIALVYDKYDLFTKEDVKGGLKLYEQYNRHRFKMVMVLSSRGNVHIHKHNK